MSSAASGNLQTLSPWHQKPVTVLGLSKSGAAVARYLQTRGAKVFLSESLPASPLNESLRNELESLGVEVEMGGHTARCYHHADLIITSPGIPPNGSILSELLLSGKTVWSEVELAYREAQPMRPAVGMVGITGTNGKSTTTTLIADIMQKAGLNAPPCGNIGLPILDILNDAQTSGEPLHALIAELSSFQLHFSPSLKAKVAVFTNLTPDHLDWHGSLESYQNDKLRLFVGEQSPDWCVVNAGDAFSEKIIAGTTGKVMAFALEERQVSAFPNRIYLDAQRQIQVVLEEDTDNKAQANTQAVLPKTLLPKTLLKVDELSIIGNHNFENVMASAATALILGLSIELVRSACMSFKGLEHRLERVPLEASDLEIPFYNDSKATNPESAISALRAFEKTPVILIAGGYDKMTPLEPLAGEIKRHTKGVVLIGNARHRFAEAFKQAGIENVHLIEPGEHALTTAITKAIDLSLAEAARQNGNALPVLFSPACASFDMFKNYEERGFAFKRAVQAVVGPAAQSKAFQQVLPKV
ncbi:MAG: UDP-N-acetylmuramoyl-L-alanine--D-glutamate ligase [Vampirovibrionales bacterium]|nr:UDP-N-acetylmuramoyl-L-alanine--D-glutamate ligase [Vampirovibrionales bacterium]